MTKIFEKFPLDATLWKSMLDYYSKFFFLFSVEPATMLVPTLFVDFCWHAHMCSHEKYAKDCAEIANQPNL